MRKDCFTHRASWYERFFSFRHYVRKDFFPLRFHDRENSFSLSHIVEGKILFMRKEMKNKCTVYLVKNFFKTVTDKIERE
jgi:hypothetical protein